MNEASFKEELINNINVATQQAVDGIIYDILDLAEKYSHMPEKLPVTIDDKRLLDITYSSRIADCLQSRLDGYGVTLFFGQDYIAIDINDLEEEESQDEDGTEVCGYDDESIIDACEIKQISRSSRDNRLSIVFAYAAAKIMDEAKNGMLSARLDIRSAPINKEAPVLKRLVKKLKLSGYTICSEGVELDPASRPNYSKMKFIDISWE